MATTDDLYSWLYNPQLYYDPRTQSYRTPGFTQATYWQDPAAVRAVEPIRSDPTAAPAPQGNSASAALRGVFPSRSANDAGGGDPGAYPMGEQGQMAPGGYAIPASDIASELLGLYDDQNLPERAMGYLLGSVPGMIPGVGNLVGRAMDFTPGPTAQRDFGRIGALAQREAEQGIPFTQADDPFAEGDLQNSELGWGLAERAAYDMGDRFRGASPPQQVGGPRFDDNGQPAARGSTPAAAPVSLAPQTTPFGETITMTNSEQPAKDAWSDMPAQDKTTAPADDPNGTSAQGGDKSSGSDTTSPGDPGGPGPGSAESSGDAPSGGGDGNGGGLGGQDVGGDPGGPGSAESGSLARGGRVTKRNAVRRGNPPGPDNIYATLQTGESVVPRDVTRGVQAGDPMSAMAALQAIGSGAPARRGAPAAKGKRPSAPRR